MYPEMFSARIRFDLCVLIFGILGIVVSKDTLSTICGYFLWFYGAVGGLFCAKNLASIHSALRGDSDMAGIMNCAGVNKFAGYDLNQISLFKAYNSCAFDIPSVPQNVELSEFRSNLINAYNEGWYLFADQKMLNLPLLWLIVFGFFLIVFIFGVGLGFIGRRG